MLGRGRSDCMNFRDLQQSLRVCDVTLRNAVRRTRTLLAQSASSATQRISPALNSDRGRIYQLFKYAVYAFLTANIFIFFSAEWAASAHRFGSEVALSDIVEGFAATIDTAAWVVLLLMFELETCVLDDRRVTPRTTWLLHGLRAVSYGFIVYAFTGYVRKLIFISGSEPMVGAGDLCALVDGTWTYATGLDEFTILTQLNCDKLSSATSFFRLPDMPAVVDQSGLTEITRLAWVDVINAAVWLMIVLVLEVDVRLQEHGRFEGLLLRISNASKFALYGTLLLAALYWTFRGDFVDSWDACLWLIAFVFIELNVFDWRHEALAAEKHVRNAAG